MKFPRLTCRLALEMCFEIMKLTTDMRGSMESIKFSVPCRYRLSLNEAYRLNVDYNEEYVLFMSYDNLFLRLFWVIHHMECGVCFDEAMKKEFFYK